MTTHSDLGVQTVRGAGDRVRLTLPKHSDPWFKPLNSLMPMRWVHGLISQSIMHLAGHQKRSHPSRLWRVMRKDLDAVARFLRDGLQDYPLEFFLQRREARQECKPESAEPCDSANGLHPCMMHSESGFRRDAYGLTDFLRETGHYFLAINAHLVGIQQGLADLYRTVIEMPFASFTEKGKSDVLMLSREWAILMNRMLVATHLQTETRGESVCEVLLGACVESDRFLRHTDYFQEGHAMRFSKFWLGERRAGEARREGVEGEAPGGAASGETARATPVGERERELPCLPSSAGAIQDMIDLYRHLAQHARELFSWSARMYGLWYGTPPSMKRLMQPGWQDDE